MMFLHPGHVNLSFNFLLFAVSSSSPDFKTKAGTEFEANKKDAFARLLSANPVKALVWVSKAVDNLVNRSTTI